MRKNEIVKILTGVNNGCYIRIVLFTCQYFHKRQRRETVIVLLKLRLLNSYQSCYLLNFYQRYDCYIFVK